MTLVVDAPVVVAALAEEGEAARWARRLPLSDELVAPHFLPVEVASVLRRAVRVGSLTEAVASLAHSDLLALPVSLYAYEPFASRVWELRHNLTPYDAWYVALAESLDLQLATIDQRLTRASGPRCTFVTPIT